MNTRTDPRAGGLDDAGIEQHLTFTVADELFAIPILSVQEIRRWEAVSRIPHAPGHILGIINLRGLVVPVMDLRRRLGIEPRDLTPTTAVIVVRIAGGDGADHVVGCVVDAVSDVAHIDGADVRPPPEVCGRAQGQYLRGISTIDDRLVMLLDLGRLIEPAALAA